MQEFFYGLFGCAILLGIPVVAVVVAMRFHRRMGELEAQLQSLQSLVAQLTEQEAPGFRPVTVDPVTVDPVTVDPITVDPITVDPVTVPEDPEPEPQDAVPAMASIPMPEPRPLELDAPQRTSAEARPEAEVLSEPKIGIEERLIGRLPVWIGAASLVLAAAYFIKLTIDQGILTPGVRVVLGVMTGLALLAAGEYLRERSRYVAQGLSATGIATLFIAFFAAVNLYDLLPAAVGFGLMALTTAAAVFLALRQGILVAIIGLVGGFLTPMLVSGGEPRPGLLFAYLLMLQLGLVTVSRRKQWWHLAGFTLGAAFLWVIFWLSGPFSPKDSAWIGLFLLSSAAVYTGTLAFNDEGDGGWGNTLMARVLGWGAMVGSLALMGGLAGEASFGSLEWLFLGLISAGCLVLARLREEFHGLAWLSAVFVTLLLAIWLGDSTLLSPARFLGTLVPFTVLFASGSYLALLIGCVYLTHWRSVHLGRWASLATAAGVAHFMLASSHGARLEFEPIPWGFIALILAAVYGAAAYPLLERRSTHPEMGPPSAALLVAATTLISLGVMIELDREWLTAAWALQIPALMWLGQRLEVPVLRKLAGILTTFVSFRLLLNPAILEYPISERPVFNGLLLAYGVPLVAIAASYQLARGQQAKRWSNLFAWVTQAFLVAFVTVEIRHLFHGALAADSFLLAEWGSYVIAWLLLTLGLLEVARRLPEPMADWGGKILLVMSIAVGSLALGLGANPLWTHRAVGETPIFNLLLYAFGIPAALLVVAALVLDRRGSRKLGRLAAIAGLATVFMFVTLEVRQAWSGTFLDGGSISNGENYAYSFAWILLGSGLMIAGVLRGHAVLRYAGLAVMVPAVFKVFLYDTRQLEGFLRVLSLVGLGVSLLLLAFLYQKFVVRRDRKS